MEKRKFIFVYFDQKELCESPDQAITFINQQSRHETPLLCNENCTKRVNALFEGDIVRYPATGYIDYINYNGERIPGFGDLATTGCSTTRIKFYPALGDTLAEHETVYQKQLEAEKAARLKENEERIQKRLSELTEPRKGWYAVSLNFDRCKFIRDDFRYVDCDFSGEIIAESGMEAYKKTVEHLKKSTDVLPDSIFPEAISSRFWFTFLGVKTDDGYSVATWEEWKEEGSI